MYATTSAAPTPSSYAQGPSRGSRRPASISELAERALDNLWDERKELKYYLRLAEKYRKDGKEFAAAGDHENAFVSFARAATLVLDKLPMHRDYKTVLNDKHRHNLGLNGQDILDCLGQLKPMLVERHEQWLIAHQDDSDDSDRTPDARPQHLPAPDDHARQPQQRAQRDAALERQQQDLEEERALWQRQREETERREQHDRAQTSAAAYAANQQRISSASAAATVAAARQAASGRSSAAPTPTAGPRGPDLSFAASPPPQPQTASRHEQQQEAMRRQADEIQRRRDEQKRQERARQIEADTAARVAREQQAAAGIISPQTSISEAPSSYYQHSLTASSLATTPTASIYVPPTTPQHPRTQPTTPQPSHIQYPNSQSQQATPQPSAPQYMSMNIPVPNTRWHPEPQYPIASASASVNTRGPSPNASRPSSPPKPYIPNWSEAMPPTTMPLENPAYEDDTTDTESIHPSHHRKQSKSAHHRPQGQSPTYPTPTTTTSPPPAGSSHVQYPQLMSQHQRGQGYAPSVNSMFNDEQPAPAPAPPPSSSSNLLFDGKQFERAPRPLYSSDLLPKPASYSSSHGKTSAQTQAPPPPSTHAPVPRHHQKPSKESKEPKPGQLKRVTVPRECLPRFLAIAKINTSLNRETCGLLLGKDRGHKYVVTTLLIPKQHATSDTCAMEDEELVLQFTEERSLITLGWIHTHPSQSCFMSSVDLHTHSAFQRMLPESFAIVCAPKYNPTFGIFRLTDPPGLQIILGCNAQEAFHPHPDKPIYTDADREHVYLKDAHLEIVDLR